MLIRSNRSFWCLVLAVLTVSPLPAALAQTPGSLDTSFGGVGFVSTAVSTGAGDDRARAMMLQPDGKIVVVGACDNNFCLVRYHSDGTLDSSFGIGGRVNETRASTTLTAYSAALQPDGKIVVVGNCIVGLTATMCATRFMADGSLDSAFGTSAGWTLPNVTSGGDVAKAVALQTDGKIVLADVCTGFASPTAADFCLVRLNNNGTLDTTFNTTGMVTASFGGGAVNQGANAVAIQTDGKIVAAGYCDAGTYDNICVARFLANGTALDGTFGGGSGRVVTQAVASMHNRAYSLALLHNGKILVGAECGSATCGARYNPDGTLDASFATGGVFGPGGTTSYESLSGGLALAFDGSFVLAGWSNPGAGIDSRRAFYYSPAGALVADLISPLAGSWYIDGQARGWSAVVMQPDGKVVLAAPQAQSGDSTKGDFLVARYHGFPSDARNCSLDIDGDGVVSATTDSLMHARIALGMTGSAVTSGITFAPNALRANWAAIRTYLVTQCAMVIP